MAWFVALLRGINVGGKNSLPMRDLVALFERAGAKPVKTYIQSGNVVFQAKSPTKLVSTVEKSLLERHQLRVPIVLRSAAELEEIARKNPFLGRDDKSLHVMFLSETPARAALAELDPARSWPDEFRAIGREIFLSCPNGLGKSKLTNDYFDRKLHTSSTVRNWRTVLTLVEMCGA